MTSSMEYHQEQLQKHCRICGNRLNKAKRRIQPVYPCKEHSSDLLCVAGVGNVATEDSSLASPTLFLLLLLCVGEKLTYTTCATANAYQYDVSTQ